MILSFVNLLLPLQSLLSSCGYVTVTFGAWRSW